MWRERRESPQDPVVLTPSQDRVFQDIAETLDNSQQNKLVILEGLSGVGKSTLLRARELALLSRGAKVVEEDTIIYEEDRARLRGWNGHVITTAVPTEMSYLLRQARNGFPNLDVETVVLKGMNRTEIMAIIEHQKPKGELPIPKIADYSLGIPHVAEHLGREGIAEDVAAQIAGGYLNASLQRYANSERLKQSTRKYLEIQPSQNVVKAIQDERRYLDGRNIYGHLYKALREQERLKQKGIQEESPLFTCPHSVEIYNAMLLEENRTHFDIYVPQLAQNDYERVKQALGFYGDDRWGGSYEQGVSTRPDMFAATYRKTIIWSKSLNGVEHPESIDRLSYALQRRMTEVISAANDAMPHKRGLQKPGELYIHSHDHPGMPLNPRSVGWMIESLLQHRGVSYFVSNRIYGADYVYDGDQNEIKAIRKHEH